jgi:hypothetical protein
MVPQHACLILQIHSQAFSDDTWASIGRHVSLCHIQVKTRPALWCFPRARQIPRAADENAHNAGAAEHPQIMPKFADVRTFVQQPRPWRCDEMETQRRGVAVFLTAIAAAGPDSGPVFCVDEAPTSLAFGCILRPPVRVQGCNDSRPILPPQWPGQG